MPQIYWTTALNSIVETPSLFKVHRLSVESASTRKAINKSQLALRSKQGAERAFLIDAYTIMFNNSSSNWQSVPVTADRTLVIFRLN